MRTTRALWRGVAIFLLASAGHSVAAGEKSLLPASVKTLVEWASIRSPPTSGGLFCEHNFPSENETALFSPDRNSFLLLSSKPDLRANRVRYELRLFHASDVSRSLTDASAKVQGEVVATVNAASELDAINGVRWLDNSQIGYIATVADGPSQALKYNVNDRKTVQLSYSDTHVVGFDVQNERLLYVAIDADKTPVARVAGGNAIAGEWLSPKSRLLGRRALVSFYAGRAGVAEAKRISLPRMNLRCDAWKVRLSPSGRFAIVQVPSTSAPVYWGEYASTFPHKSYTEHSGFSDPTNIVLEGHLRLELIDLDRNSARALMDAPLATIANNGTPRVVVWAPDEKSVLVSGTYLPLQNVSPEERSQRKNSPAIAQVAVETGEAKGLIWEDVLRVDSNGSRVLPMSRKVLAIRPDARGETAVVEQSGRSGVQYTTLKRVGNVWSVARRASKVPPANTTAQADFDVLIEESLTQRAVVVARGRRCACQRLLLDPNPEAEGLAFSSPEAFRWNDPQGHAWQGILLRPVGYREGQRYPLVLQTHGLEKDRFFLTGQSLWGIGAYAAQALAGAGFAVLQIEDNADSGYARLNAAAWADAYKAAIDAAVAQGLVDPDRVAITAWSATGGPVEAFLERYPRTLRAAVMSDTGFSDYLSDLQVLHLSNPTIAASQPDGIGGFGADPESVSRWMSRRPLYRMKDVTTAVRLEALQPGTAFNSYEAWALLRNRRGVPAELVYIPADNHWIFEPQQLDASLAGTVDWYRYWMQDYRDPEPEKVTQYGRWDELRSLRDAGARP